MTFGEKLEQLRKKAGLTQAQLAEKISDSIHSVRNHEQDLRSPVGRTIFEYARALGVDCSAFADCDFVSKPQQPPKPTARKKKA